MDVGATISSIKPALRRAAFQSSRSDSRNSMLSFAVFNESSDSLSFPPRSRPATPSGRLQQTQPQQQQIQQQQQHNVDVLRHLSDHASTYGIDVPFQDDGLPRRREFGQKMSHQGEGTQSAEFLSWRKLHLSKAKLKAASNTSALLAGFAMVAMVEIQLNKEQIGELPKPLLYLFAICTTLLVAVHMLALLISTCILPNIEAISNMHALSLVHESPHEKMHMYIELAWGCSTVLGILLFMIEVTVLCWIQFYNVLKPAAYVATAILVPFVAVFIMFAFIFYRNLVGHTYEVRKTGIQELEMLKHGLELGDADLGRKPGDHQIMDNIV